MEELSVVEQHDHAVVQVPVVEVAERYGVPRTTVYVWVNCWVP